jgi:hypothetical protein
MTDMLASARETIANGVSVIPTRTDGTKAPGLTDQPWKWSEYQQRLATDDELVAWYGDGLHPGMGVVTGDVSGNLEMLEVEGRFADRLSELFHRADQYGLGDLLTRITGGWFEQSPSGGYHWFYRVVSAPIPGNMKLAQREALPTEYSDRERELAASGKRISRVLIETRGNGGQVVVAPSHGPVHASGRPWIRLAGGPATVAEVTADERADLIRLCRSFGTLTDAVLDTVPALKAASAVLAGDELSPGDDFNVRGDWTEILTPFGWKPSKHGLNGRIDWTRPDKGLGVSATSGGPDGDLLFVYSTSTELPDNVGLSKWRVFAMLNCGGDFAKAASELRRMGYGSERPQSDGYRNSEQGKLDWAIVSACTGSLDSVHSDSDVVSDVSAIDAAKKEAEAKEEEWFWNFRPIFAHIRQFSRERLCPPHAVLAHVLLNVVACIMPQVQLPALIGSKGSLNLFVAIVGKSGSGKGMARAVARECVVIADPTDSFTIGSGEGIAATYVKPSKIKDENGLDEAATQYRYRAMFHIAEVSTLEEIAKRGGSTIIGELNKMYTGESLGFHNRAKETRLPVLAHTYRACLTMDVQPDKASVLLDNDATGFPQRFMFVQAKDPGLPDDDIPEQDPTEWNIPPELRISDTPFDLNTKKLAEPIIMDVCETARTAIRQERRAVDKGEVDGGHHTQTTLKVAASLAILDARNKVLDDDWTLAKYLMRRSANALSELEGRRKVKASLDNAYRAKQEGDREVIKGNIIADDVMFKRACKLLHKKMNSEWQLASELKKTLKAGQTRNKFDASIAALIKTGVIEVKQSVNRGQNTTCYRLAGT